MFSTLKGMDNPKSSFVLEPTRPPFHKKREGKLARVACTHCRVKKLKCSGERSGCTRCISKNIDCFYPGATIRAFEVRTSPSSTVSPPDSTPEVDGGIIVETKTPNDNSLLDSEDLIASLDDSASISEDFRNVEWPLDDLFPVRGLELPHLGSREAQLNDSQFFSSSPAMPAQIPNPSAESDECATPTTRCYSCINQAIEAYESIEIDSNLLNLRGISPTNSLDAGDEAFYDQFFSPIAISVIIDVLQHQRAALKSCSALMTCIRCSTQSPYVMFVISVCSALLEVIEHLKLLVSPFISGSGGRVNTQQSCPTLPIDHDYHQASENRGTLLGRQWQQDQQEQRRGVQIGHWTLDEDDEQHVVQGLIYARIAALGKLTQEVDRVVEENRWLAHEGAIRRVRERYTSSLGYII